MANTLTFANLTLTDADIYGGITYTADLNTGEEFSIGNTVSASVSFLTDTQLPLYSKDQTNGVFTWTKDSVSRGTYYITEVIKAGGRYTVTAYDAMILLDVNISALSLSFPLSVSAAAAAIAAYLGCTVSGTVNNGSLSVSKLDDMSIRQLLSYVAEASGCSVKIAGNSLCFMYYADSQITVTASQYRTLETADYTCSAIDNVTIIDGFGATVATAGAGTNSLFIQGNPFLDAATNTEAQTILSQVSGFVYAPLKCELFEDHGIEIGTMATFGTTATLVMHLESSENGVVVSSVGSDSREEYNKTLDIIAAEAYNTAKNIGQYFWHMGSGADPGVHITEIPKDDFLDDPSSGGSNLLATSNGIAVRDGLTDLATFGADGVTLGDKAKFGATARIGRDDGSKVVVTEQEIYARSSGGYYYRVGDLNGTFAFKMFFGDGVTRTFPLSHPSSTPSVKVNDVALVHGTDFTYTDTLLTLNVAPSQSAVIEVDYWYGSFTPYFTFGNRSGEIGEYSASFGDTNESSGVGSFAEGYLTHASGAYSHAQNLGTKANSEAQTVIGKYNIADTSNKYALIVGNGTALGNGSNALTVDWDGNVDASGTVLGKLKRVGAITGEAPSTEPTIASGASWKNLQTITLTTGVWMVTIGAEFAGNSTGIRAITLSTGSSGATTAGTVIRTFRTAPASTGLTTLQATFPVEVSSTSQVFYLNAFQTSGSTLTVKPRYTAVKIGNSTST